MEDDIALILSPQRWNILSCISQGISCATTIAEKLEYSIPYVNTQLKILEAAGYLKKNKKKNTHIGKPRTHYSIIKELAIIAAIKEDKMQILSIKPSKRVRFLFNTLFSKNEEELYFLQKFYYTYEHLILETEITALIEQKEDSLHFLVITKNVEEFRTKYSNIIIQQPQGKEKKIVIWSHTKEEVIKGIENKEAYFLEKVQKATAYWEKTMNLKDLQKLLGEEK
jgi:DNA-binding MarR family transcriptional regulator